MRDSFFHATASPGVNPDALRDDWWPDLLAPCSHSGRTSSRWDVMPVMSQVWCNVPGLRTFCGIFLPVHLVIIKEQWDTFVAILSEDWHNYVHDGSQSALVLKRLLGTTAPKSLQMAWKGNPP